MNSQAAISQAAVLTTLAKLPDPDTGRPLGDFGAVRDVNASSESISATLEVTTHAAPLWKDIQADAVATLQKTFPVVKRIEIQRKTVHRPVEKLGQIGLAARSVIAVGSGKGGVGKSTIAASLAYGLKRAGCQVGLMDADVYGPSIPHLVGLNQRPEIGEDKKIVPIELDGMKTMSMGYLVPPGDAVVWRGPMLHGAIQQFLRDTAWGELDYLVIDMPPGTGDISITLSQLLPLTGAVVVCTPQDVALLDAVKAIAMFRKVNIPILGMVENMSYFLCPDNGKRYDIFGHGGARQRAQELEIPFLGEVPIQIPIRQNGDQGRLAENFANAESAPFFEGICLNLARNVAASRRAKPAMPALPVL